MSVCAVMLVKDEADIVGFTIRHLLRQVDHVVVADNMSTDGTREIVQAFVREFPGLVSYELDENPAYVQSDKTTRLALEAAANGYDWVLPCDADEWWYAVDGRPIRDWLSGISPDIQIVRAELVNHIPTAEDDIMVESPFERLRWRLREHAPIGKVCVRSHPHMRIAMGNHSCWLPGAMVTVPGFVVRHYSWRSEEQYLRKIRNGEKAYAATTFSADVGAHWRMWEGKPDEAVLAHFRSWFWSENPRANSSLIMDPAPVGWIDG